METKIASSFFYELFEQAGDMIMIYKPDKNKNPQHIIMVNAMLADTLGYTRPELLRKNPAELMSPVKAGAVPTDNRHPDILHFERTLITKTGRKIESEIRAHSFEQDEEELIFAIIRDISDRKKHIRSLERTEQKYKRLVEKLSNEYIFYTHDNKGMITYVSPSVEKILGYSQDEALRDFREFLTDSEMNKKSLRHSLKTLEGIVQPPFLNELFHRDGSTRIFYNTEIPVFDEEGRVIAVEGIAYDVTARMEAEDQLKKQELYFRMLVENISEVFWIFDLKVDKLLYISPQYETVYGRTRESLYNKPGSFLKLIHPDDVERVKKAYRRIPKGTGIDEEYRLKTPDGKIKWIWSQSFIIHDEKNKPHLSIGKSLDITQRVQQQLDKNLLAAILENTEDHAVIKDTDMKIIASNRANTLAAGKKKMEEMIDKTDLELYGDHDYVRKYMEDDRKALKLKKGETLVDEQVFVYPDKRKIYSLVKKFPVYNDKNQVVAVASISRDITDYKNALNDLSESEQNFRTLINNQGEGIGLLDKGYRFTFANPMAGKIFEINPGNLIRKSLTDFTSKTESKKLQGYFEKLSAEQKKSFELRIKAKTGKNKHVQVTATPQYRDNVFLGIFVILKDITEAKRAADEGATREKQLKEANAFMDKFFSVIARKMENPFSSILDYSELLTRNQNEYGKNEILTITKMIQESARQANDFMDNLLKWSMVRTGRLTLERVAVDLYHLVDENIRLLSGNAGKKKIRITNLVKKNTMIRADQVMMNIVLKNLISNAIKYTRNAGRISLVSRKKKDLVELSVEDNGIGIPEEHIGDLFRVDKDYTTPGTANEQGSGLGLVLSRELINRNGGTIEVRSKPDKGTVILLTIPAFNQLVWTPGQRLR